MDFSDLVAKKIKELMKEKNINSNKLSKLTGIYRTSLYNKCKGLFFFYYCQENIC